MEIERKYLVDRLPEHLQQYPHTVIEQAYLCTSPVLRIRRMGDAFVLTVKEKLPSASTAIHNREEEFSLTEEAYNQLLDKHIGHIVRKTRYKIDVDGYTAELDIFEGRHSGLRLVEVEFPSTAAADRFTPPSWFGRDVSQDPHYRNSRLAMSEEG